MELHVHSGLPPIVGMLLVPEIVSCHHAVDDLRRRIVILRDYERRSVD